LHSLSQSSLYLSHSLPFAFSLSPSLSH
jgi:hypothetical protein